MKVFEFNSEKKIEFPEDIKKILDYLQRVGKINPNVSEKMIEELYKEYSGIWAAGWLLADEKTIKDFAKWLSEKEI